MDCLRKEGNEEEKVFGAADVGGTLPEPQSVTVTNTGEKTVTVQAKDDEALFRIKPVSGIEIKPGASAEFTVQPKAVQKPGSFKSRLVFSAGSVEKVVTAAVEFRSGTAVLTGIESPKPVIVENGSQKLPGGIWRTVLTTPKIRRNRGLR